MYNQNKPSGIRSFNRGASNNRYAGSKPQRSTFSNTSRGFGRSPRRGMIVRDPNIFVKKAQEVQAIDEVFEHNSFEDFDLTNPVKQNILSHGYTKPTPIQDEAIPSILEGRDLIGIANTGTGKTAAFLIPIINKIFSNRQSSTNERDPKALIIAPTRELAVQINSEFRDFAWDLKIYSALVIGGSSMGRQMSDIRRNPHVVIATPGRLKDLVDRKILYLEDFNIIVLDEVDLMVDIGFINDIKYFIARMPKVRQSLFFSATVSPKIQDIVRAFVNDPVTISIKKQGTAENIDQDIVRVVNKEKKMDQLHDLLIQDGFDKVLIFGSTKHGIEKLNKELLFRGFKTGAIHGNKNQSQRMRVLESFKREEIQILLATDVASRGLDINDVTHVINYDLPNSYEDYIHRIGRTGRAGKMGKALTFVD